MIARMVKAAAALLLLTAATPPQVALPGPQAISESDKAAGAKADPELSAEFGGVYDGPQAALVRQVGAKVAAQSGIARAERDFSFKLLNSAVPNAFAIPGGYVYATRALLALMNDEAELAFVLGHETGHITGRHSEKRQKVVQRDVLLGTLGQTVLGAILGNGAVGQIGGQLGQAGIQRLVVGDVMHHSRSEEFEADDFGIAYMERAGYDGTASSDILGSLAAQAALDAKVTGTARTTPSWAMSHPEPAARVARSLERARALGGFRAPRKGDAFLLSLKGMIFGDDPEQGVIEERTFKYPPGRIQFTAPAGYGMANRSDAVIVSATGGGTGNARFAGGRYDGNLPAMLDRVFASLNSGKGGPAITPTRFTVNGLEAVMATAAASDSSGKPLDATAVAVAATPTMAYTFAVLQPRGRGLGDLAPLVNSVRRMSEAEAAAIRPRVIDVVTVGRRDTVATMAARMAYPDLQTERFLVLNGLPAGTTRLAAGRKVKLVVWGSGPVPSAAKTP
ncbi:MAG: M48 family metalloprotease [Alphaproteobacteria bacterium]|nr:M48 family metalloprotease [Alphaproteobacteria bacterium]